RKRRDVLDVHAVPHRRLACRLWLEVRARRIELGLVDDAGAHDPRGAGDTGWVDARVVEQHEVADRHRAHVEAREHAAHAGPRLDLHALEIGDRERVGLGLHQPVLHEVAPTGTPTSSAMIGTSRVAAWTSSAKPVRFTLNENL